MFSPTTLVRDTPLRPSSRPIATVPCLTRRTELLTTDLGTASDYFFWISWIPIVFQWADDITHNGLWDREISHSTSSGNTHAPSRLVVLYQSGSLYPVCMTKVCICMMLAPMRYPLVINDICHNLVTRYIEYNWRRLVKKTDVVIYFTLV